MTPRIPMLLESNHDVPIIEIRHILRSGALVEPPKVAGVGRIALRLLRRGAAGMGRKELDEAIDRIAAVISTQATPDFYALHVRVLSRFLDRATEIFAKVVSEPTFEPEELERLKRETIAEIVSSRDDDRHLASRALRMLVFGDHPYGRPSRGTVETVDQITMDDVREFLDRHLLRQNILVGASGDIDEELLGSVVEKTLGRLPADIEPPPIDVPAADASSRVRVLLVDKPGRTQTQMFLGHLGPHVLDPMDLPLRVALTAFGGTFTSTLMQEIRVKRGWSYGAYASFGRGRLPEVLSLWSLPSMTDATPCLELMLKLFSKLKREGPSEEEIAFARDYLARGIALQRDTAAARLTLRLRQELLGLPKDYYESYAERVRAISHEQAIEAVRKHLDDQHLNIAITCTASELRDKLPKAVGEDALIETISYDSTKL